MRIRLLFPALLLFSLPVATTGLAQVTVDPRALEPLTPALRHPAPAHPAPVRPMVSKPVASRPSVHPAVAHKPVAHVAVPDAAASVAIPAAPPALPVVPPPIIVPTRPPSPTPPPAIQADAPGTAAPLQGGLRLTFGAGRSDLNPITEAAIRALVHGDATTPAPAESSSFTITSYAAGTPDDPSTARRLSLARALAVRSVLISQGVASPRIYPKAWGPSQPGFADGPADRADITIGTNPVPDVTAKSR